jgi:hypothetical protein
MTQQLQCYYSMRPYQARRGILVDELQRIERRLKLHGVRVLMANAEAGSMGKAARRLQLQPAIPGQFPIWSMRLAFRFWIAVHRPSSDRIRPGADQARLAVFDS